MRELRPDLDVIMYPIRNSCVRALPFAIFFHSDRVLIGFQDVRGREVMQRLYQPLALRDVTIVFVKCCESAELAKYAANALPGHEGNVHQRDRRFGGGGG